jgi:hypothetical protein
VPVAAVKRASVQVFQPVQRYFLPFRKGGADAPGGPPFPYTHLGTDCGLMGPGRDRISWQPGLLTVDLAGAGWAGVWHSLAGLGADKDQYLDFGKCYPAGVRDEYQPRCVGIALEAGGRGRLKVEVIAPGGEVLWQRRRELPAGSPVRQLVFGCSPDGLRQAKYLNWVAEPGSEVSVRSLGLVLDYPPMPLEKRVFLISYAKLARCYVPAAGVVKDRAHLPAGAFDAVPASGLFCLATCAAWRVGVVERPFAERVLREVHGAVGALPRALGLLPHFVRREGRVSRICPGTEYSTVDTSLYYHSMLLAAQMVGDEQTLAELSRAVRAVRFDRLRDAQGFVSHGLAEDGRPPLPGSWRAWGGETALVLLLERMAVGPSAPLKMSHSGRVDGGVGFIAGIQSLFYPQFSLAEPDAVTGVDWLGTRRHLLQEQRDYFPRVWPGAAATRLGLYGLSAGEGPGGQGYMVEGTATPQATLIYPHYVLMSALLGQDTAALVQLLGTMEEQGLVPPWGMVENVKVDLSEYLPMIGSLNAAFECVSAYHLWAHMAREQDHVYEAVQACSLLREAVVAFYPASEVGDGLRRVAKNRTRMNAD